MVTHTHNFWGPWDYPSSMAKVLQKPCSEMPKPRTLGTELPARDSPVSVSFRFAAEPILTQTIHANQNQTKFM